MACKFTLFRNCVLLTTGCHIIDTLCIYVEGRQEERVKGKEEGRQGGREGDS